MAKFVVFAKRIDPLEARLRVFCMTDDKEDKTLEYQEHFTEVAKSRDVEVLEGKPQYTEFAGNLVPVTKSGEQLHIPFKAFRENRLPFNVRVKDQHADTVGRALFMREPRVAKGEQPQQPICILNIVLPEEIYAENTGDDNRETKHYADFTAHYRTTIDRNNLNDIRIVDISNLLGEDWIRLAPELGISEQEVADIIAENPTSTPRQAQSMLQNYILRKDSNRTVLETSLRSIKRDDIIKKCLRLSSFVERPKQSSSSSRKHGSLDNGYEEADIMKDSESVEELAAQGKPANEKLLDLTPFPKPFFCFEFTDHRMQLLREREELKYSAEEKIVEDSDGESQDEGVKKSVAERREQIQKRLSIERQIPASTQQKEIVQEVVELKRRSLIEDKKALHEEEIIMHAPTDNIIKSATIPDPVIKLKSTINDEIDVTKTDFDKELEGKIKTTLKNVESFEHKPSDEVVTAVQEKIQIDSIATEKPFKKDESAAVGSSRVESVKQVVYADVAPTLQSDIEATRQFLEQEHHEIPVAVSSEQKHVDPYDDEIEKTSNTVTTTTTTTKTIRSTKDFLEGELAAHQEPESVVTKYVVEEFEGPDSVKTIKKTTTTTTSKEWSEPVEIETVETILGADDKAPTQTTIRVTKEVFHGDGDPDDFYKTFEEKITKKMSQDFTIHKDDNIADGKSLDNWSICKVLIDFHLLQYQMKF